METNIMRKTETKYKRKLTQKLLKMGKIQLSNMSLLV